MSTAKAITLASLALTVLMGPAQASTPQVVLDGAGNSSAGVTLTSAVTLDLEHLIPDAVAPWSGIAVRDASGKTLAASIQVQRWVADAKAPFIPDAASTVHGGLRLAPGRYTFVLLAPGSATVRVPTSGTPQHVHAKSVVKGVSVHLTDLRTEGLPVANHRSPATVTRNNLALLVFHERATAHQASTPSTCFAAPGARNCAEGNPWGQTSVLVSPGSVGDGFVQSSFTIWGSLGEAGTYDAIVQDVTVDSPRVLDALLLVV